MLVKSILKDKGARVVATGPDVDIAAVAKLLNDNRIGAAVVLDDDGKVVGIISERDIARGVAIHGEKLPSMKVKDLMTKEVITAHMEDTVDGLMAMMTDKRIRHLPVLQDGRLVGIISIGDVVKHRIAEIALEANSLKEYVMAGR